MSPVIRECERRGVPFFILHTGQHYSYTLDEVFFEELRLPTPKYNLQVGSGTHAEETGKIMIGVEKTINEEKPDVVLVEGDTNTVLAAALASVKLHVKSAHLEAGLRSGDLTMPEEINRIVADHVSDVLLAPTDNSKKNLMREGIEGSKIFVTGNTIVDAVNQNLEIARRETDVLDRLGLKRQGYFLVTTHRAENVDIRERLKGILSGLELIHREFGFPVVCPAHPRTAKRMREFSLETPNGTKMFEPLGYLQFLQLEENARLILTDSGGVQEEACTLRVPCVTVRDNTERPETLEVGSNLLVGASPQRIAEGTRVMLDRKRDWRNPFGDGNAGKRTIEILEAVM
jgi:UDP-N-acetylglucosamine 2-epimerase (non-hydrolysing)